MASRLRLTTSTGIQWRETVEHQAAPGKSRPILDVDARRILGAGRSIARKFRGLAERPFDVERRNAASSGSRISSADTDSSSAARASRPALITLVPPACIGMPVCREIRDTIAPWPIEGAHRNILSRNAKARIDHQLAGARYRFPRERH